jgi:NADPH:quinone reductase-like Zn-dependent oxidoreductase
MLRYRLTAFGLEHLALEDVPLPEPGPGELRLAPRALSLNYRDLMIIRGTYNPRLELPVVPLSDAAGVVTAIGPGVTLPVGSRVMTHFVAGWQDGPFDAGYLRTTLGTPGPGLAAQEVILPAHAVVEVPSRLDFAAAATLPIAALTAWSALVTVGRVQAGQTVLTLGTGGVSVFALQLGTAMGAKVVITSSSDVKLARALALAGGAAQGINYGNEPEWDRRVKDLTAGRGADLVVETGGVGTLDRSLRAVRGGGTVALLGALTGLSGKVDLAGVVMRRITVAGIMVDSRRAFADLLEFIERHRIAPVIGARFSFDELPAALRLMARGGHFGKIVVEW